MVRNYLDAGNTTNARDGGAEKARAEADPLRELQRQWSKILTRCYDLYAEGKRCVYEEDPLKRFDCTHCEYRDAGSFCQANAFLKRVVSLVAEHLASKRLERAGAHGAQTGADDDAEVGGGTPPAPLTQAQIDEFKAQGVSYEIETPLCAEHVWMVPERTGQDRLEFTPEEIHFMAQAAETLEGTLVEIARSAEAKLERSNS